MFGFKRSQANRSIDWPSLLSLLEDDDRRAATQQLAPGDVRQSYLTALRRADESLAEATRMAGKQLHSASLLVQRPTVAVAGMLNSGKTSLVATFLSPHGQARSLRGTSNDEGTHRFVLWLPESWKADAELWGLLISRIGDALGAAPEMLADDPAEAHQQYNNRSGGEAALRVPLIATDEGLDEAGIGLLDCPDIVSDESLGLGSPETRRHFLGKAATLCSAFLVVTSAESSRDANLSDLLHVAADLMPGVPRMLAVNKVRPPQTPEQVHETFSRLAESHGLQTIYAAYDYEIPRSRPFIPGDGMDPRDVPMDDGHDDDHPVFFSVDPRTEHNPPAEIDASRLLTALPGQLDRAKLFESFQASLETRLTSIVKDQGVAKIAQQADQSIRHAIDARRCLLDVTLDFFALRDVTGEVMELRLHQSERIIRQLSEAFADTAPWYARWSVRMNASVQRIFGGVKDFVRQLTPTALARRAADDVKDKFKRGEFGGLLTPDKLAGSMDRHGARRHLSHWPSDGGRDAAWKEAAEAVILRFERDDFTSLDPRRLREAAEKMWAEVPRHKKLASGLTPLIALFATMGGVLVIPVDFGASAVAAASISELFAAAGLTTLSAIWAGNRSMQDVGHQAARQQVADFHAVLCDAMGVPRGEALAESAAGQARIQLSVGGKPVVLPPPGIVRRDAEGPTMEVFRVRDAFRQELSRLLS